jgi:GTP cyclohydrolase IA
VSVVDQERAAAAVRELLLAIGEDPDRDGLRGTPERVARSYTEIYRGVGRTAAEVLTTTFEIGYIPGHDGRVTGLSKLARLVDVFARRPQIQERMTSDIADALVEHLQPRGVLVVIEAEHLCMAMRGVRRPGTTTITSAVRGQLRDGATRAEAMSLLRGRS